MERIIPETAGIVNFYSPERIEQIARETGFMQRESKLDGTEFSGVDDSKAICPPRCQVC